MRRIIAIAALLLTSLYTGHAWADGSAANSPNPSTRYTITDLGSMGLLIEPTAINDRGQIVGWSQFSDGTMRAFLWQHGKIAKLSVIAGDKTNMASAINNKGQIVGTSSRTGGVIHAVLWNHGTVINLGSIGSGELSGGSVQAINDAGQIIVNEVSYPNNSFTARLNLALQHHRVLLCTGNSINNGRLLGRNIVIGIAINNSGAVVGYHFDNIEHNVHGYLWKNGVTTDLGNFYPSGINASGVIVGTRKVGMPPAPTAAIWKNSTLTPLSIPSATRTDGTAINDKEEIIGVTDLVADFGSPHAALLWRDGNYVDLGNSLLPKDEWTLIHPTAMNNLGQIVGYGKHSGKIAAFLMTPIVGR